MGNIDRIVVITTKLTKSTHGDFFFQGWAHRVSLQKLQNFLKIEIRLCLIYFGLNLRLKLFDQLICFCFFSPCFQCWNGKRWQKCFFSNLTLFLEIVCSTITWGRSPPVFLSSVKSCDHSWKLVAQAARGNTKLVWMWVQDPCAGLYTSWPAAESGKQIWCSYSKLHC